MTDVDLMVIRPDIAYAESFSAMADEFIAHHGQDRHGRRAQHFKDQIAFLGMDGFIQSLHQRENPDNLPSGFVPSTEYWLIENSVNVVGRAAFRHYLTDALRRIGGHIGYEIRPSRRRQGYGVRILALMLDIAREHGLERAMVTCHQQNTGSRRIIEKNGGQLIGTIWLEEHDEYCSRYWIDL